MNKYIVSFGSEAFGSVTVEHTNPQSAMLNALSTKQEYAVIPVPQKNNKATHWSARNLNDSKDELVITDRETAKKLISSVRNDGVEIFWFNPDLTQSKTHKIKIR